jgi:hypothetical protein
MREHGHAGPAAGALLGGMRAAQDGIGAIPGQAKLSPG